MPYLNLDLDYFTHPKVMRLADNLGPHAVYYPIKLWCYAGKHFSDSGMLQACSKTQLEKAVGWDGETGKLIDSLVEFGFLERKGDFFKIHDWKQHAGHLSAFKKRAKTAAKTRWSKYASSTHQAGVKLSSSYAPNLSSPLLTSSLHLQKDSEKKEDGIAVVNGAKPKVVAVRGSVYPEGFEFDERAIELAKSFNLNPHKECAAFRDHHVAKGSIFKDWQAAFRNWMRNSVKFAAKGVR